VQVGELVNVPRVVLFLGPSQKYNCSHVLQCTISAILIPGLGDLAIFYSSRDGAACDCRGSLECAGCASSSIHVVATLLGHMWSLPINRFLGSFETSSTSWTSTLWMVMGNPHTIHG
jgi:hypothetical protein